MPERVNRSLIQRMATRLTAIDNLRKAFPNDYRVRVGYKTETENLEADCRQLLREQYGYTWNNKEGLTTALDYAEAGRDPWLPRVGPDSGFPLRLSGEEVSDGR